MVAGELSESRPVNYRNDGRSESESATWNADFGVQAPAQALNAVSVGAVSLKRVRDFDANLVAAAGNLAPSSRTAQAWPVSTKAHVPDVMPTKPDIVMEGGVRRQRP